MRMKNGKEKSQSYNKRRKKKYMHREEPILSAYKSSRNTNEGSVLAFSLQSSSGQKLLQRRHFTLLGRKCHSSVPRENMRPHIFRNKVSFFMYTFQKKKASLVNRYHKQFSKHILFLELSYRKRTTLPRGYIDS